MPTYKKVKKTYVRKYKRVPKVGKAFNKKVSSVVNKILARNIETKTACITATDGVQIQHNNLITCTSGILNTTQGLKDSPVTSAEVRIGDTIKVKGVSMKMMLELNERYSDCTFRIMVIRARQGDPVDKSTIFVGLSGNKMLDSFNSERFTLLKQKWCKITAPNRGTNVAAPINIESGLYTGVDANAVISRATKIVKLWVPGSKFGRYGVVKYDNGAASPKFFDYHVCIFAYSNYSASDSILLAYNVARLNDYVQQVYFTDA